MNTTTEMMNMNVPWKMSPNITPNWNGNVTQLKRVGLISLYRGTPYVSVIICVNSVHSFWRK